MSQYSFILILMSLVIVIISPFFISDIGNSQLLSLFRSINYILIFKELHFGLVASSLLFMFSITDVYLLFPYFYLICILFSLLFIASWARDFDIDFKPLLLFNINIDILLLICCFGYIPQILICYIFIIIQFKIFLNFHCNFLINIWVI